MGKFRKYIVPAIIIAGATNRCRAHKEVVTNDKVGKSHDGNMSADFVTGFFMLLFLYFCWELKIKDRKK